MSVSTMLIIPLFFLLCFIIVVITFIVARRRAISIEEHNTSIYEIEALEREKTDYESEAVESEIDTHWLTHIDEIREHTNY